MKIENNKIEKLHNRKSEDLRKEVEKSFRQMLQNNIKSDKPLVRSGIFNFIFIGEYD